MIEGWKKHLTRVRDAQGWGWWMVVVAVVVTIMGVVVLGLSQNGCQICDEGLWEVRGRERRAKKREGRKESWEIEICLVSKEKKGRVE